MTSEQYDFKGNLLRSNRRLAVDYREQANWSALAVPTAVQNIAEAAEPTLEKEIFTTFTAYDALNRPVSLTTPDWSETIPTYNEANLLERVEVRLRGAQGAEPFVTDISYNAKGQRERIDYSIANGQTLRTEYAYNPLNFRLTRLKTTRLTDNALLQDLSYTFDPVGNILEIQDQAQQTVFFKNAAVSPSASYEYDALYRLIRAEGREHAGQGAHSQPDDTEFPPLMNVPHENDGQALRRYTELYQYDAASNILRMIHQASGGNWTRRYEYDSLKAEGADTVKKAVHVNNRLRSTSLPGDAETGPFSAKYVYDAHGNMIAMPHLRMIEWDFKDQMRSVDLGGGGTVFYVYDSAGQRIRKVWEKSAALVEERIYLGGYEIFRRHHGGGLTLEQHPLVLERETLHIMDDTRRIALVETKTVDASLLATFTLASVTRYQLGNHLGSAVLELDEDGSIISYEEYHPYGTTSYHAARSGVDVSSIRYRYTGKERDDETGFYYHGARYYASWLGRWTSCDPIGVKGVPNLYWYARNNPVVFRDPNGADPEDYKGETGGHSGWTEKDIERATATSESKSQTDGGGGARGAPVATREEAKQATAQEQAKPALSQGGARGAAGIGPSEPIRLRDYSKGSSTLGAGIATAGVGLAVILSGPPGWVAGTTGALMLSGGIATSALGGAQLMTPGLSTAQHQEINKAAGTLGNLSSMGGLVGGVVGMTYTGSEKGLQEGAAIGSSVEAGTVFVYSAGRAAVRELDFGIPAGSQWSKVRPLMQQVYGISDTTLRARPNPLFSRGVERIDLSHFIPQRDIKGFEGLFNRPWNVTPMWATEHAMIDPSRFQFMQQGFKDIYGAHQLQGMQRQLNLAPPWMAQSTLSFIRGVNLDFPHQLGQAR